MPKPEFNSLNAQTLELEEKMGNQNERQWYPKGNFVHTPCYWPLIIDKNKYLVQMLIIFNAAAERDLQRTTEAARKVSHSGIRLKKTVWNKPIFNN